MRFRNLPTDPRHVLLGLGCLLIIAGCATPESPPRADRDRQDEAIGELRREALERKSLEPAPAEAAPAVTGEAPAELLAAICDELETRTGIDRREFMVLQAEAVRWPDGALGCPVPGAVYPQAPVDGYRVVIRVRGSDFDYRADDRGRFRLCPGRPFAPPGQDARKSGAPFGAPPLRLPGRSRPG